MHGLHQRSIFSFPLFFLGQGTYAGKSKGNFYISESIREEAIKFLPELTDKLELEKGIPSPGHPTSKCTNFIGFTRHSQISG